MNALITDEMVEAGVEEIRKAKHTCFDRWTDHDAIRAVLEAGAEPALAAKDADIARLREAALAVLASWDERMPDGPEQRRTLDTSPPHEYWSPAASMVASEAISALRIALAGGSDASTAPSSTTGEAA